MTPAETSTRHKCLAYIRKHRSAYADDIAMALGVTSADIRHHLNPLVQDGLLEVEREGASAKRGRPRLVYRLSRISLGDNLSQLTDALLIELRNLYEAEVHANIFQRIADRFVPETILDSKMSVSRRLPICIELLNSMNYQARWEAHAAGPRIIFEICPYLSVIENHPEVCQIDQFMLEKVLGGHVRQISKLEKGTRNIPICVFEHYA